MNVPPNLSSATIDAIVKIAGNSPFAIILGLVLYFDFTSRAENDREFVRTLAAQNEMMRTRAVATEKFAAAVESVADANNRFATAVESIGNIDKQRGEDEKAERAEMVRIMNDQGRRRDAEIQVLQEILRKLSSTK